MPILDAICSGVWAIEPQSLVGIIGIVEDHATLSKEEWDERLTAVEKQRGRPLSNDRKGVTMRDGGVATIEVVGPIVRRADLFSQVSGMTSIDTLAKDFGAAMDDRAVKAIVLAIDSPGGEVTGVAEFADMIRAACSGPTTKPVVAYVGGMAASAGYWLASAAERVVCDSTALLGSIGVVQAVRDPSRDRGGTIEFVSSQSPHKRPDPTTGTGAAQIQGVVDAMAGVFVAAVARNRDVSEETVLADFGGGGLFVGQAAVAAGLADRVGSYESVLADLAAGRLPEKAPAPASAPGNDDPTPASGSLPIAAASTRGDTTRAALTVPVGRVTAGPGQGDTRPMAATKTTDETIEQTNATEAAPTTAGAARVDAQAAHAQAQADAAQRQQMAALEARLAESETRNAAAAAQIARINAERIQDQAVAFAESELLAGRATPAEAEPLVALYAQAAHDDAERPAAALGEGKSRVSHLKATQALRAPHGLTQEQLDATQDGAAAAAAFDPSKLRALATPAIVAPVTTRDEKPKTTADVPKERAKDLLGKSRLGLAALKAPAEK
jgi:ClpP class serine protease